MPWMWSIPSKLYGFQEMGFVGMGLCIVLVRERWFWRRERDGLWVLRERKGGNRDLGWGQPWKTVGRRNSENLVLIVCGRIYGFICKMLT